MGREEGPYLYGDRAYNEDMSAEAWFLQNQLMYKSKYGVRSTKSQIQTQHKPHACPHSCLYLCVSDAVKLSVSVEEWTY